MPTFTEVRFAHEDCALADTFEELPDVDVRVLPDTSTVPEQAVYVLRFDNADHVVIESTLKRDHTVGDIRPMPEFEDNNLWGIEFVPETKLLSPSVTRLGGLVIDARSANGDQDQRGWHERWLLPDREAIYEVWQHAREEGFEFEIIDLHPQSDGDTRYPVQDVLTDQQRTAQIAAYEEGYFAEPREASLEAVADSLDHSPSAVGGLLRRGMESLIDTALLVDRSAERATPTAGPSEDADSDPPDQAESVRADGDSSLAATESANEILSTTVFVEHRDLALVPTVRSLADTDIGVVSDAGTDPHRGVHFFWVETPDWAAFERALDADHTAESYAEVTRSDDRRTYRIEYADDAKLVTPAVLDAGGLVVESRSQDTGWRLELELQGHDALYDVHSFVRDYGITFEVLELHHTNETNAAPESRLTDPQVEALVTAYHHGYYDEPREVSLNELADALGISPTAASGRLKRGSARLVEETLVDTERNDE